MRVWSLPAGSALRLAAQDAQVFFITIAVLLGTGILGLPVKLVQCGFWPFAAVFSLTLTAQLAIIAVACGRSRRTPSASNPGRKIIAPPVSSATFDATNRPWV